MSLKSLVLGLSFILGLTVSAPVIASAPTLEVYGTNVNIDGHCSGTVVNPILKVILTAGHCSDVKDAKGNTTVYMTVLDDEGNTVSEKSFRAHWLKADKPRDVALLQIDDKTVNFTVKTKLQDKHLVGEDIYCVGMPFGEFNQNYISKGIFARYDFPDATSPWHTKLLMVTCPIAPGMSGGAVYNDNHEQIGIIVGALVAGRTPITGYAYAVPISEIEDFIKEIK